MRANVSLLNEDKYLYQENGEVIFKEDGIGGIVILNMSQKINAIPNKKNVKLVLDLASGYGHIKEEDYEQYVSPKVAAYLNEHHLDIHALAFSFKSLYDYNIAEVSHGGISLDDVSSCLESKKEKGLFFSGEVLDIDGACGGYNLMFAFASAELVKECIKDHYVQ